MAADMTQWRVSPEGERQYLAEDGYWYVAPLPPPLSPPSVPPPPPPKVPESAPEDKKEWDDNKFLRGTLSVVGGLMGVGRWRASNIEYFEAETARRRAEKGLPPIEKKPPRTGKKTK
jgi:hypothetical protein